jgi:Sec-independent protein translocase protein TatA
MTETAAPVAPKRKRKLLVAILVAVLLIGSGTAGWFAWSAGETTRQAEAKAAAEQKAAEDAAAAKKDKSDAYWAKVYEDEKAAKAKTEARAAAKASADRAAATKAIAEAGWSEKAPGIFYADSPDHTCDYTACAKFNVMTTLESGCPGGIVIRGRWLNGETVTGSVFEVTGPVYANEQAAVEANDYGGNATSVDLTEFSCR